MAVSHRDRVGRALKLSQDSNRWTHDDSFTWGDVFRTLDAAKVGR
ncbi:MAG: hypothetical protein ACRD0K_17000 [Egibacteraceae bacterium]